MTRREIPLSPEETVIYCSQGTMDSTVAPEVEVPALLSSALEGEGGGEDDGKQQQQQQEPSKQISDRISHSHNHVTGDVQHGIVGLGQGIGHRAQDAAAALRKKAELLASSARRTRRTTPPT